MSDPRFYAGGFYLVRGGKRPSDFLPDPFWTPSDCICDLLPGAVGIPWVNSSDEEKEKLRGLLGLDPERFEQMQSWIGQLFERGEYGWSDVFLKLEAAVLFCERYLRRRANVKLLAIALPEPHLEGFLRVNQPGEQQGESGVFKKLSQRELVEEEETADVRGFDILGDEWSSGSFHCFTCNGLEKDYTTKLGIQLNEFGLIPDYEAAVRAADYTNLDSTGAEPVLWQPWRVTELPLELTDD